MLYLYAKNVFVLPEPVFQTVFLAILPTGRLFLLLFILILLFPVFINFCTFVYNVFFA